MNSITDTIPKVRKHRSTATYLYLFIIKIVHRVHDR